MFLKQGLERPSTNSTLIQYFKKNVEPKIPGICYATIGLLLEIPEIDLKHAGKFYFAYIMYSMFPNVSHVLRKKRDCFQMLVTFFF